MGAVGTWRTAKHDIQGVESRIQARTQNWHGCLDLRQFAFGLTNLVVRRQTFAVEQVDFGQKVLLCLHPVLSNGQARLQPPHGGVDIGCLRGNGKTRRDCPRLGSLVLTDGCLPITPQPTKQVDFPACLQIEFIAVAVAVIVRR
ncbi:hypothetical protein D3C80_973000 [compost metagenome]